MKHKIPYLKFRNGRPRWEPGPSLRAAGFKGIDLKHDNGKWMEIHDAIKRAEEINEEIKRRRAAQKGSTLVDANDHKPISASKSCNKLFEHWRRSPQFQKLAESTKIDYVSKAQIFLADFGEYPVRAIEPKHVYGWWNKVYQDRGHAMANGLVAVARTMLSYAMPPRLAWITSNPAAALKLEGVSPRVMIWTPEEISEVISASERLDIPSIGDAVVVALHTGQRQGDILRLELPQLVHGRARFMQAKTGSRVSVPFSPALADRIEQIKARRASAKICDFTSSQHLILSERNNKPYDGNYFRKCFRRVRSEASRHMLSILEKQFLDLRDTAITRLAQAGCTVPEIRAITGHSLTSITEVLKHYLAIDDAMADTAIERLKTWMSEEGIRL